LPFDLLVKSKKETNDFRKLDYLVKDYSFSYTLSNSLKTINSNEKHTHENALSIYKPKIPTEELSKLTLAENLANRIAERYDSKLFLNSNSTIENFKKSLMESKTVSVLSHGMSSNYISDKDKGIYLSDGLLSMDSIYALEANTDFLILNACDTANGFQDADQGNLNLVRAFKSIGVKSILSANWQIDEYSSTSILESFFENLEQHKPKSVALSEAKLNFINSNSPRMANPIYWAGLNITGDNSPVELEQNDSLIQIIFYTLIFVFLLFFALVLKKRFQNRH
jgi:CHAT domain-containing protein